MAIINRPSQVRKDMVPIIHNNIPNIRGVVAFGYGKNTSNSTLIFGAKDVNPKDIGIIN